MFKRRIGRVKNECVSHQGRFVSACSLSCFFPQQDAEFRSNSGWRELISFLHFKKYFSIDRPIFVCSGWHPSGFLNISVLIVICAVVYTAILFFLKGFTASEIRFFSGFLTR
jgi:hypothetical protein